jgi:hypothetical protein
MRSFWGGASEPAPSRCGGLVAGAVAHRKWLIDGPIDGEGFRTYVEKALVLASSRATL